MRVFLGPVEISGFYAALNTGLRQLGVDSTFAELWPHPYRYEDRGTPLPAPIRWTRAVARRQQAAPRGSVRRTLWAFANAACRTLVFCWAAARFDVFVFAFTRTVLQAPAIELRILRLLRRRIVFHFHGSDSRPPYLDGYNSDAAGEPDAVALARQAARVKRLVRRIDSLADIVVDSPLSAHFHTRPCVNSFIIGLATVEPPAPQREHRARTKPRALHAPSHARAKGTTEIRQAITALRANGVDVEYVEIVGQPNERVKEELLTCDFVIDQLYSDTPMAGFAAEAARAGRPAIVGGYAGDEFSRWIPAEALAPTLYVRPEQVTAAVQRLATEVAFREDLAGRAHDFALRRCSPRTLAERYLRLLTGSPPDSWFFDPGDIRYLHGCGLREEEVSHRLSELIASAGEEALQLSDKPALVRSIREFLRG